MRGRILAALACVGLWLGAMGGLALAQDGGVAPRAADPEIQSIIEDQMAAFRARDIGRAFGFASPNLQTMFGSPDRFGAMVRNGYPMVWQPGDVRFGPLQEMGGALWQRVIVTDGAGVRHVLDYRMDRFAGDWRISAVRIVPAADVAA